MKMLKGNEAFAKGDMVTARQCFENAVSIFHAANPRLQELHVY